MYPEYTSSEELRSFEDESTEPPPRKIECRDIFESASKNDLAAVEHFVEKRGKKVTDTTKDKQTIAHIVAKNGNLDIVK